MSAQPLRFVTFLAPNVKPLYQLIADEVGRRLDRPTELIVGVDYDQAVDGSMDVGFICGLPYVVLNQRRPGAMLAIAAPVLRGERYAGKPVYFSDVIVRRDSAIKDFGDLRGRRWAYNEPLSHSGYGIVRDRLLELGESWDFFGEVVAAGFHQRSIRLVASGAVEASAIDSQVLEIELRDHPQLAEQLKVIDVLGPSTIQPIVTAGGLPAAARSAVIDVATGLSADQGRHPVLERAGVQRIVPVADADYDDIRRMVRAAESAGFQDLGA